VNSGHIAVGLGLALYGAAFLAACWWYVGDDDRLRRLAETRWWFDRRFEGRVRRGQVSRDEWFVELARSQRFVVRRVFPAFFIVWFVLTLGTAVRGLLGN